MIREGSRVRHINPDIDTQRGVMVVRKIKNGIAICGYDDFYKIAEMYSYNINELKLD